ncbi:hypothetical protein QQF64_002396 [Cirrhinus molitorella]|uniref:Uncharacterized protein n=1 Tax=Cirrhinus molitorella TaxID=172907 RepID=A0ABR3MQ13_9TELE
MQACGNQKQTAEKFLEDSRTHEKFKKNNLERSTCVPVENLPAEANNNKMLLELYFEKWGPVEELPEPITVSVHPAIREFILKKGQSSSVKDQMSSHFCQINLDKPETLLSPDPSLLKQKGVTRRHINDWSKNAIDAFKKIISNYTTSEWLVSHALRTKVESDIKNWVLEKKINIKQKHLQIGSSILDFLRSVDCDEMSTELFKSHGITAVYTIENRDVVVIGSTERALAEAENMINMVLTTKDLIVEDQGVLEMTEWKDLKKQLEKRRFVSINLSHREKVIVTRFREPVMERLWIKLSGERAFVQPALTFFKRLADALYTDTLIIKKAGAKKYFMEQGKLMLSMLLKEKRFVVVLQEDGFTEGGFEDIGQVSCVVRKADICYFNNDSMVSAANEHLKHSDGVALAADPCLQQYCDQHREVNGPRKLGDAIITDYCEFACGNNSQRKLECLKGHDDRDFEGQAHSNSSEGLSVLETKIP